MAPRLPGIVRCAALGAFLSTVAGCNLIVPAAILAGPPTREVEPEFARLPGKRVLVLVWTPPAVLTNFPYARYDVAKYVADALRSEIEGVTTVSTRRVEDYLEKRLDGTADPVVAGEAFDADVVVYLEVLNYRMRLPESPNLYRAQIEASIVVYERIDEESEPRRYELTGVAVQHPEGAPVSIYSSSEHKLRKEASEIFAENVALKFKSHRVEI